MSPTWHPTVCKNCERGEEEMGRISASGLCIECGVNRHVQNNTQLMAGMGPFYDRWRAKLAAAVASPDTDER